MYAVNGKRVACVQLLLDAGADVNIRTAVNSDVQLAPAFAITPHLQNGESALMMSYCSAAVTKLLLEAGARVNEPGYVRRAPHAVAALHAPHCRLSTLVQRVR